MSASHAILQWRLGSRRISGGRPTGLASVLAGLDSQLRRNFTLDLASAACYGVFTSLVINFLPVIARRLGADSTLLALLVAAPFASNIVVLFAGFLIPSQGRTRVVAITLTVSRGLFLLCFLITNPAVLVAVSLLFQQIHQIPMMVMPSLFRQMYPTEMRGRLMGYVRTAMATSSTLAALAGGWLLDTIGYRLLLPLGALFGIVTGICWFFIRIQCPTNEVRFTGLSALRALANDRILPTYTAGWFIWGFGAFMVLPLYPIYLVDRLRASYGEVGILTFISSVCWMASFLAWGRFVDRQGGVKSLALTFAMGAITPAIYALEPGLLPVALAFAISGVVNAGTELGWITSMIELSPPERVSQSVAAVNGITGLRGLIVPFVGSFLSQVPWLGLTGTFVVASVIAALGAAVMLWSLRLTAARGQLSAA